MATERATGERAVLRGAGYALRGRSFVRGRRGGQVVPIVLICMVVMAILGIAVLFTGTSDYSQSALVVYGLRAQQLALAAQEEAQAALYDLFNSPVQPPPKLRLDLLKAIRNKVGLNDSGDVDSPINLLADGHVKRSVALAAASRGEIQLAQVRFYGFKRVKYTSAGLFGSEKEYYRDPFQKFDTAGLQTPEDFVGYYTVKVRAKYGKITRELTQTHDLKIVDVSPPARQFALFSYYSAATENGGPPPDYGQKDLNEGGGLKVYAAGSGRVFIRGPFLIKARDVDTGAGGKAPPTSESYPPEEGQTERQNWHGWSAIPSIRDGIMERAGPMLVNFGVTPRRPDQTSNWRPSPVQAVNSLVGSALRDVWLFNDAGWYIKVGSQQPQWYAGSRAFDKNDPGAFSLVGEPEAAQPGSFSPFVGHLAKYTDKREVVGTSLKWQRPDKAYWVEPDTDAEKDLNYSIEAEGGLIGEYNRIKFDRGTSYLVKEEYNVTVMPDKTRTNYGYRWEKSYTESWWDATVGDLVAVASFGLLGVVGAAITIGTVESLGLRPFAGATPPLDLSGVKPTDVTSTYPPGYRPFEMLATRRYASLKGVIPAKDTKKPLVLDGVVWADDLTTETGFAYKGRGVLVSDGRSTIASDVKGVKVSLPIVPAMPAGQDPKTNKDDWLTLVYLKDEKGKSHLGDHQIEFVLVPEVGDASGSVIHGSVMSLQGARPKENAVEIAGNYVCGFPNKSKIPAKAKLNVHYNTTVLPGADDTADAKFGDGSWHVIAISPRLSGWYDRPEH
ncbi:MAG: hypothetical protein HYY25_10745 [Candidatus Wallbacteria bacterium]|nr:hypothetical protein [Candidatus Wallbacteria bacterium]